MGFLAICLGFALVGLLVWLLNIEIRKNAQLTKQMEEEMFARENAQKEVQKLQALHHDLTMQLHDQKSECQRLALEKLSKRTPSWWLARRWRTAQPRVGLSAGSSVNLFPKLG